MFTSLLIGTAVPSDKDGSYGMQYLVGRIRGGYLKTQIMVSI